MGNKLYSDYENIIFGYFCCNKKSLSVDVLTLRCLREAKKDGNVFCLLEALATEHLVFG